MASRIRNFFLNEPNRRWGSYLIKSVVVLAFLVLLGQIAPLMPAWGVAIFWAILSSFSAIGLTYHVVMSKAHRQFMLKDDGKLSRLNSGRILSMIVAFVVSAVCIAGLILESPKWELADWLIVALAIPLYAFIFAGVKQFLSKEYEPLFQVSHAVKYSSLIVGALLCIGYLALCLTIPSTPYANATEAFMAAKQPFASSPSALLSEAGKITALVDGATAYGLQKTAEFSLGAYLVWRVLISASAFFGVANLVGTCMLEAPELASAFKPLNAVKDSSSQTRFEKKYLITACVLPLLLIVGSIAADSATAQASKTNEYTAAESFVRDQVGLAAYVLDGKYYDQQKAQALIDEVRLVSENLAEERERVLTPLINEAFDKRLENVDSYLDWYYSLPADYERLVQYFTGTVESGMRDQLAAQINNGVDESELETQITYYLEQSEALVTDLQNKLAEYEIDSIPDWLIVPTQTLDTDILSGPLAPTQKFLDANARMGISAGVGAISGIIATKVAQRILAKPFFKKVVAELVEKLAVKGLLAEGGTIIAPGAGTVIGLGIGLVADFLFLKADEAMNRESYKEEIVSALEESRQEMLAMVSAAA